MNLFKIILKNKIISLVISVGLLIFIFGLFGNYLIQRKFENWPIQNEKSINSIISSINQILDYHQQKLLLDKNEIINKLNDLEESEFGRIAEALSFIGGNSIKLCIFKADSLIYWNEIYNENLRSDDTLNISFGETYFVNSGINTYLAVRDTFTIRNITHDLYLYKIIEKHYQLNEEYFHDINLTDELSRKVGVEIFIDYTSDGQPSRDGRKKSLDIKNNENNKIGTITFLKPSRENAIKKLEEIISTIQGLLFLAGFIFLGVLLNKELLGIHSKLVKTAFLAVYLTVLRYIMIFIKFPQNIYNSDLFSEIYYFSNFGNGLAYSPGDLLITLVFAFILLLFVLRYTVQYLNKNEILQLGIISRTILIIFLIVTFLLSLRGIGAAIRGTVFDTTLRYFQSASIIITFPHFLMHLNILLLGIISLLGSAAMIIWILRLWKVRKKELKTENFFHIFLLLLIGILIITFVQNNPQLNVFIKVFYLFSVLACVFILLKHNYTAVTLNIVFFITASIFSIASLLYYNTQLEKSSLKTTASIISRYDDEWYKSLIKETLLSNFTRREAEKAFKNERSNYNSSAFKIWSKSQLQQEAINSSVNLISLSGNLLGGFGSVYPTISLNRFIDTNTIIEEIQIFEEPTQNESQKLIRGIFPVKDEFAFLGYVDVSIFADLNDFGFSSHPSFISTGKLNEKAILKLDKLVILDYRNSELKIVYGDLNPNPLFNQTVLNAEFTKNFDAWKEININGAEYLVYLRKAHLNEMERIIAVALKEKELSISLFDFFKVFFSHAIILIIFLIIYFIYFHRKTIKYEFDLRKKLLLAFLIISLIPLILTALYFRNLTDEKNNSAIYYKLGKRAFSIDEYLNDNFSIYGQTDLYRRAAEDLNLSYSVYKENMLEYSTNDLIYDVGLIPKMLHPKVYEEIILKQSQEILINESVDDFKFDSFYYRTTFLGDEIIIKVTDGFNKILLPFSGTEVDVFLFGFYSLAVVLILIFSAIFANQISKPIRKITLATKSVAAGDLSLELKNNSKGELGELVSGFQYMIRELKKNQTLLAEIEREEAWKEMAKQVAHEIKNPLTPMKLSVQQLIAAYNDKSEKYEMLFKKVTASILNQIETLRNIATEFSNFARMPKLKLETFDCSSVLVQSIDLFSDENIELLYEFPDRDALVSGDSDQLKRTLINLIRNSIQAEATKIIFTLNEGPDNYELRIIDNGKGIDEENLSKVFEPNFTTKKQGMGLGLSMAKRYLRSSGGDIIIEGSSREGTILKITLPRP